ncbi:MAG: Fic family protein, partial [Bacilli bacterium]|nr:Fic family protein [Bacilli bacterium]
FGAMLGRQGEWKKSNNFFDSKDVFYIPLPHDQTPKAMEDLCQRFNHLNHPSLEDLDDVFLFILHFICIHPLQNGNGRVSAFLLQALLYKAGFKAAIYIPIDALMGGIYGRRTSIEIRRASGSFYGKKELDLTFYTPYLIELLDKSYDFLIESSQGR